MEEKGRSTGAHTPGVRIDQPGHPRGVQRGTNLLQKRGVDAQSEQNALHGDGGRVGLDPNVRVGEVLGSDGQMVAKAKPQSS